MSPRPAAAAVAGRGLVDPAAPLVAADDEGFARGRAAFETLRVYDGRPFRLAEHLDRLVASARMLDLPEPDRAAVRTAAEEALAAAGLLDAPLASGPLMSWGEAGAGKWVTIWSSPAHVFMEVAGIRFDTSGQRVTGSRWQNDMRSTAGFVARHPRGL